MGDCLSRHLLILMDSHLVNIVVQIQDRHNALLMEIQMEILRFCC